MVNKENIKHLMYIAGDLADQHNKIVDMGMQKVYSDIIADIKTMHELLRALSDSEDTREVHNRYKANIGKIRMGE